MQRHTMLRSTLSMMALAALLTAAPSARAADDDHPVLVIDTTMGPITVELDRIKAPISVENFLKYVDKGFYDGTVFHRVIGPPRAFMVQTGGFTEVNGTLHEKRKDAFPPIKNESGNGLSNARGTLAMARTDDPDSATSQFFINLVDNRRLDNWQGVGKGYTVFGKVTSGMDVVDNIARSETTTKADAFGRPLQNVPVTPIMIKGVTRKSKA
jgi:peptidyl-prolyl cis-trans isomerase A (cyclophilin A)